MGLLAAGASFSSAAASTQTILLANTGNSSVQFNVSATPTGLFGGWISVAPTTGGHLLCTYILLLIIAISLTSRHLCFVGSSKVMHDR